MPSSSIGLKSGELKNFKKSKLNKTLQMLTCYDYPMAQMLAQTDVDMLLVGDSLGNVILGLESTVSVTLEQIILFTQAVRRGASNKFIVSDMPFGSTFKLKQGLEYAQKILQQALPNALKIEGAHLEALKLIEKLTYQGVPILGHIGLTPQSIMHMEKPKIWGKSDQESLRITQEAFNLQEAGVSAIVLECISAPLALELTQKLKVPTIGIGSGSDCDGQVLVTHDLLQMGLDKPPKFVHPQINLFEIMKESIQQYLLR